MELKNNSGSIKSISLFGLIVSLIIFTFLSCESGDDEQGGDLDLKGTYQITEEAYTFFADPEKYGDIENKRAENDLCDIETEITKVQRSGNTLTITITRPEDCEIDYELIWNGEIRESFPMQSNLYIHSIGEGCEGELNETDVLVIDLEEALKDIDASIIPDINFMIKDACHLTDIQCADDCDVTVIN